LKNLIFDHDFQTWKIVVSRGKTIARIAIWTKVKRLPLCPNHNGSKRDNWPERDAQAGSLTVVFSAPNTLWTYL
jgi:hypothetical protein